MFVDSHCHLNYARYKEQEGDDYTPAALVNRAREAGVRVMQSICTHPDEFDEILGIAERFDGVYCSFGVHPHHAEEYYVSTPQILEKTASVKVIGIGETGLDYYYENAPKAAQRKSFERHLEAAVEAGLPVIIHSRDAESDMIAMLKNALQDTRSRLLFHCFTGSDKIADFGIENGISFSAPGIITFKKSNELRATYQRIPTELLMLETDAPFLAPEPHRGKLNEPAFMVHTAHCLAELKQLSIDELAEITNANFFNLFTRARQPQES